MELSEIRKLMQDHQEELILQDGVRYASLLIPLVEKDGQLQVLFEVRSSRIAQAGEISFPGGHLEKGESAWHSALRETCEELLLKEEQVEIIAPLHRLADRGRIVIDSFLGILHDYQDTFNQDEVERVFCVPLKWLLEQEAEVYTLDMIFDPAADFPYELIPGGKEYPFYPLKRIFYFYRYEDQIIWGLTGQFLHSFLKLLRS